MGLSAKEIKIEIENKETLVFVPYNCYKNIVHMAKDNAIKAIKIVSYTEDAPQLIKFSCIAFTGYKENEMRRTCLNEYEGHIAPSGRVFLDENGIKVMYEAFKMKDIQDSLVETYSQMKEDLEDIRLSLNVLSEPNNF